MVDASTVNIYLTLAPETIRISPLEGVDAFREMSVRDHIKNTIKSFRPYLS